MMTAKRFKWLVLALIVLLVLFLIGPPAAWASGDDDDDCRDAHSQCGHNGGAGGAGGEGGEANADASTGAIDNQSQGGGATVNTRSENTSLVLSGARDTADCFTKIGIGAEGFGVFWSRSDPFCKKVRLIASHIDRGNLAAAARLECTLKEWGEVYGHSRPRNKDGSRTEGYQQCLDDLDMTEPTGVTMTHDEYHELTMTQVSQEEYQEQAELVEYRYAQQQELIEDLEEEVAKDDAEIRALKKIVNEELAQADARRAAVRAKLAEKREEESDGPEGTDN